MTDPLGQSQVLPYLVELSKHGYRFTILSFEKPQRYEKEGQTIRDIVQRHGITWVPLTFTKKPPVLSKIYDRWRLSNTAARLHREIKFDMIHCRSYVAAEVGLRFKKKYGTRFLFDMRGFWADEKVDSGQWNQNNFFFRQVYAHYKGKEKQFLLNADAIVSLTHAAKKELQRHPNYQALKIDVIPCCADLDHFNYNQVPAERTAALRAQLGIDPASKVITYLGSVGGWYMTKEMFGFFGQLIKRHPEFVMLILTKDKPETVKKQAADLGVPPEKLVVLYSGRNELPGYISLSDCSIFFIRPTYSKIASSPTKHAELMGMGIPVICNDIGDTGHVIDETGTGEVIKVFNDKAYDKTVGVMNDLLQIPKSKIREAAYAYFDLAKGADDYLSIYRRILKA